MDTADGTEPLSFALQGSDVLFRVILERPNFDWIQNWTRLVASVFDWLQPHGLSLADIKLDAAGSFADFQLTASFLGSSTVVRLKLDNVEVQCYNALGTARDLATDVAVSVFEGIRQDYPGLRIASMTGAVGLHGIVGDVSDLEFLSRFSQAGDLEMGHPAGAGTVFYFGKSEQRSSAAVTVDRSAKVTNGVFVHVSGVWNASLAGLAELPGLTRSLENEVLAQLRLTIT